MSTAPFVPSDPQPIAPPIADVTTDAPGVPPRPIVRYRKNWWLNIPAELKAIKQWVVWRFVFKEDKKKWTKQPFWGWNPKYPADVTDTRAYATFEQAFNIFKLS